MKVSPEIVRPFPKSGLRKSGGRKHGKRRILTDTTEKIVTEYQRAKKGKRKYAGKILQKKTVQNKFITVDSCEEEP
jgi:molybdenum-dependent DNA-binding transcriptional regulator ModE